MGERERNLNGTTDCGEFRRSVIVAYDKQQGREGRGAEARGNMSRQNKVEFMNPT